jgi:hypothetical protein
VVTNSLISNWGRYTQYERVSDTGTLNNLLSQFSLLLLTQLSVFSIYDPQLLHSVTVRRF